MLAHIMSSLTAAATAIGVLSGGTSPPHAYAASSTLGWTSCEASYECATLAVPLDYDHPDGPAIGMRVIRHRASDPGRRIGTLVFNPGGPGGPGVAVLPLVLDAFPAGIRARFDIVSFDPRGVGHSDPLHCFGSARAEDALLATGPQPFPVTTGQDAAWNRTTARFAARCRRNGGPILNHMSTANVARDIDRLRAALGSATLTYYGVSYGTVLGATYANLFPDRVRSMVLDGNVDPEAWSRSSVGSGSLPTALRLGSDRSVAATLRAFLDRCGAASTQQCAFSAGTARSTRHRFAALLDRLRRHPVTAGNPSQRYTYAATLAAVKDFLSTVEAAPGLGIGWAAGAALLEQLWRASDTSTQPATARARSYDGPEQQLGVLCSDSPNPDAPAAYVRAARIAAQRSGPIGLSWSWFSGRCAAWPGHDTDRYAGPWNRPTAPVLVVGNTDDPATPYADAVAMTRELSNARLLTVRGYGHTELLNPSACATQRISSYLVGHGAPARATCRQRRNPFA